MKQCNVMSGRGNPGKRFFYTCLPFLIYDHGVEASVKYYMIIYDIYIIYSALYNRYDI